MITRANYSALVSGSISKITADDMAGASSIIDYAFRGFEALVSVEIPTGVEKIGNYSFSQCTALESVVVAASVNWIGSNFVTNSNCTVRMLGATPPKLRLTGTSVFYNFGGTIIVPKGCGDAYKSATNWSAVASFIVEENE
jgi:hypothetical protein